MWWIICSVWRWNAVQCKKSIGLIVLHSNRTNFRLIMIHFRYNLTWSSCYFHLINCFSFTLSQRFFLISQLQILQQNKYLIYMVNVCVVCGISLKLGKWYLNVCVECTCYTHSMRYILSHWPRFIDRKHTTHHTA